MGPTEPDRIFIKQGPARVIESGCKIKYCKQYRSENRQAVSYLLDVVPGYQNGKVEVFGRDFLFLL